MPLQNRVDPSGAIAAVAARGTLLGNRGGRIHSPETRTLTNRRWASRRWISCKLAFKGRRRKVMGESYTELFFLDEVTALAAGHRPCFECRRDDAVAFAACWAQAAGARTSPYADEMDFLLHAQRLKEKETQSNVTLGEVGNLPDGTMVAAAEKGTPAYFAVRAGRLLRWSYTGYSGSPSCDAALAYKVLTPAVIVGILKAGYGPLWHPSASEGGV